MEAIKSLKSYWRRQAYQRLEDVHATKKIAVVRLGNGGNRWRWSRKTVVVRQAMWLKKFSVLKSLGKVIARLRDAYVNAMLVLVGGGGGWAVWDSRILRARQASLKSGDFDKRVIIHLYNSVIATR